MRKVLDRLSYANVTATLALFVALGGTSYAVATLPRNSVGPAQLRKDAVGSSEIRRKAVKSSDLGDRSIRLRDISNSARNSLRGHVGPSGPAGPAGPTFSATISSDGRILIGNAKAAGADGPGGRLVKFSRSLASCVPTAGLTVVAGSPTPPNEARVRARPTSAGDVLVETWDGVGAAFYAFNLIVAC